MRNQNRITPAQARQLMQQRGILWDVRTPAEYAAGHIPSARNVPLDRLEEELPNLPSNGHPVIVCCRSGQRSAIAAELLAQAAMGAAGQVVNGFLALAASVYLLCGKAELLHTARLALRTALPPRTAGNVLGVFAMANKTFSGYIGGQLVDAILVGGETFVLMLLFGIPYAPLISVVVAVTNIVPMLGPYLGAVPGAALLLFSGQPVHALEFLVIVLVVQQVDGNFIAPRILGSATGISGLWVLAAIVVGGGLFGIPGMVIGVPVLGVAANLAKAALPREPDGEKTKPGGET